MSLATTVNELLLSSYNKLILFKKSKLIFNKNKNRGAAISIEVL